MELEVVWTDFSKNELKKIFDYHRENVSLIIARKIIKEIIKEIERLITRPNIGQEEELLSGDHRNFRYLVSQNYKIIYWVNLNKNRVEIFDVFDVRQNPQKIKRGK